MALKHTFVSAIADGGDTTLVRPSNWNADHSIDLDGLVIPVDTVEPLPSVQTTDTIRLYDTGKHIVQKPAFVTSTSSPTALQNFIGGIRASFFTPSAGINAAGSNGFTLTTVGTATARAYAPAGTATARMKRIGYVSPATAGSLASIKHLAALCSTGDGTNTQTGFLMVNRFAVSDAAAVAGARMAVGLTSSITAATNVDPSTLTNSCVMAQLSTNATQLYVCFGGTVAQTPIALGATNFPAGNSGIPFEFTCYSSPFVVGVINWQARNLSNGVTTTGSTVSGAATSPAATVALSNAMWRTNNATALAVGLDVGLIYLETPI